MGKGYRSFNEYVIALIDKDMKKYSLCIVNFMFINSVIILIDIIP